MAQAVMVGGLRARRHDVEQVKLGPEGGSEMLGVHHRGLRMVRQVEWNEDALGVERVAGTLLARDREHWTVGELDHLLRHAAEDPAPNAAAAAVSTTPSLNKSMTASGLADTLRLNVEDSPVTPSAAVIRAKVLSITLRTAGATRRCAIAAPNAARPA